MPRQSESYPLPRRLFAVARMGRKDAKDSYAGEVPDLQTVCNLETQT
jgi:hypothetical protein